MRLAWAKTKKMKDLPSKFNCCKGSEEISRITEGKVMVVDLDDVQDCLLTPCKCGAPGEVRKGFKVISEEVKTFGDYVFVEAVDIAEGKFDPSCKPTR